MDLCKKLGIVYLPTTEETHWVEYIHQNCFDSMSITWCPSPDGCPSGDVHHLMKYLLLSEKKWVLLKLSIQTPMFQTQIRFSLCSLLFICNLLDKVFGENYKSAVSTLYYQMMRNNDA